MDKPYKAIDLKLSAKKVNGRYFAKLITQSGITESGKNTPDKNIIGKAIRLVTGAAVFSSFAHPEIASPNDKNIDPPRNDTIAISNQTNGFPCPIETPKTRMPTRIKM